MKTFSSFSEWVATHSILYNLSYPTHNISLLRMQITFSRLVQESQHPCRAPLESTCYTRDTLWSCKIKPGWSLNSPHSGSEITQGQWSCWRGHCLLGSTSAPLLISCCFTESYTLFRWHLMGSSESWQWRGDMFLTSSTYEPWWACSFMQL